MSSKFESKNLTTTTPPEPVQERKLFQPFKLSDDILLDHRVVLAPLTRFRALEGHVHTSLATTYYTQRVSPSLSSLLITEGTFISPRSTGWAHAPGIFTEPQITAWKEIVDSVHRKGGKLVMQLFAAGRAATVQGFTEDERKHGNVVEGPSAVAFEGGELPRALDRREVEQYVRDFGQAAVSFVRLARGDGVEVHVGNGYLLDQFISNVANLRTEGEGYEGGTKEGRTRFALEVVEECVKRVGQERVGVRISPFSEFQGVKMAHQDLISTFTYFISELKKRFPSLLYLHAVEPRISGAVDRKVEDRVAENLDFIHEIWKPKPILIAGGFHPKSAIDFAEKHDNALVVFGRHFISNPDLPRRIREGLPLTPYNRETFYVFGPKAEGYTDYPFVGPKQLGEAGNVEPSGARLNSDVHIQTNHIIE
ncbi:FMN-linked oxidoreductase [Meredithblackwellia eburnea MCA 4105]